MDVKQMEYFMEIAHTGSFTSAAKRLFISVPGLVKTIDKLETELGVHLFTRKRTGVMLTPAGMALLRQAPDYIRQYEHIRAEMQRAAGEREARVEVGLTWGLLSFFPRDFISRFVLKNPDVSLITHNYELEGCHRALLSGREAISLYFGQIDDPALQITFHREAPLVALMSQNHPLAGQQAIGLRDLRPYRLVLLSSDPGVMGELQRQLVSAGCAPQIILDSGEWTQAIELIENAGYISFCLPPGDPSLTALRTLPVRDLTLTVNFNMATLLGAPLSDAERCFMDYVVELMNGSKAGAQKREEIRR